MSECICIMCFIAMSATVSLALAASERARANSAWFWGSMSTPSWANLLLLHVVVMVLCLAFGRMTRNSGWMALYSVFSVFWTCFMFVFNMAAAPESVWSLTSWGLLTPAFVYVFFCLNLVVCALVAAMLFSLFVILGRCVGIEFREGEFMFDAPQEEGARGQAQNRGEAAAKQNAGVETRSRTRTRAGPSVLPLHGSALLDP